MQKITSKDGTQIAFEKAGEGPALLIAGGSLADHRFYLPLAGELARSFTVYNFDRRGRGQSGNTRPYAVEREVEDVEALIAHAGEPAFLYGHSAGSALAIRAAAAGIRIAGLALADPPYTPHGQNDAAERAGYAQQAARIQELHDRGDLKGSVKFFLGGFGLPDEELDAMLESPAGMGMLENAGTLPYDYAMLGDGLVPTELAARITAPAIVFAPEAMPETAQALVDAMPNARFHALEAPTFETPPEVIARVLEQFFIAA